MDIKLAFDNASGKFHIELHLEPGVSVHELTMAQVESVARAAEVALMEAVFRSPRHKKPSIPSIDEELDGYLRLPGTESILGNAEDDAVGGAPENRFSRTCQSCHNEIGDCKYGGHPICQTCLDAHIAERIEEEIQADHHSEARNNCPIPQGM